MSDHTAPQSPRTRLNKPPPAPPIPPASDKPVAKVLHVLDTTAMPDSVGADGRPVSGARTHQMPFEGGIKSFTFQHGTPLPLPPAMALKFLKHYPAFLLTDEQGNPQPYNRRPKQQNELEAGERLIIKDDETVARYDELSNSALQRRILEMPDSDKFAAANPSRTEMIAFIVSRNVKVKEETRAKVPDVTENEFVPMAELEEEAA